MDENRMSKSKDEIMPKPTLSNEEKSALDSVIQQIQGQVKKQIFDLMKDGLSREEATRIFKNTKDGEHYTTWSYPCEYCKKKIGSDTDTGFKAKWESHLKVCSVKKGVDDIRKNLPNRSDQLFLAKLLHESDFEEELKKLMKKYKMSKVEVEEILDTFSG